MAISALMMEGADAVRVRLDAAAGAAAGWVSLFLLENMMAGLDEIIGILHTVVIPDFVMDMRAGAASGRANPSEPCALADPRPHPHAHRGQVGITRMDAVTVIDFHHIAITAAITGEHHHTGRGGMHHTAPRTGEIDAGMKGITAGEGIDPRTKSAGSVEIHPRDRRAQRHMIQGRR